jgi:hypothetical protein
VAKLLKTINKIPFAPVVAIAFGVMAAILMIAMPLWRFEQLVTLTGLPRILSFARPPLGDSARGLAALFAGLGVGLLIWLGLSSLSILMKDQKQPKARGRRIEPAIVPPSAESGLPQRRPIFAERDLGAPFMSDEVLGKQMADIVPEATIKKLAPVAVAQPVIFAPAPDFVPAPPFVREPDPVADIDMPAEMPSALSAIPTAMLVEEAAIPAAPAPAPTATAAEPTLADLMARLETALDRRQARGLSKPTGDIASLRQALGGLTTAGR